MFARLKQRVTRRAEVAKQHAQAAQQAFKSSAWRKNQPATLRLTLSYVAVIMAMSLGFSLVFYHTSSHELGRALPPPGFSRHFIVVQQPLAGNPPSLDEFVQHRITEGRSRLLGNLVMLNIVALITGSWLSYLLARRTLRPIEDAMMAQERFASDASHELRTPLAAIQTENEVALRKSSLTLPRAKELLASNIEEVKKLRELAEGLLRLTRTDASALTLECVPLQSVVSDALGSVVSQAQAKNIAIEDKTAAIAAYADAKRLAQVLVILLDNAIKYSAPHKKVEIAATAHDDQICIMVRDHGYGISPADLPYIFDRFYRADTARSAQQAGGYGLGLSIARQLIHQMDGEITVVSEPGAGSTFSIVLPPAS